MLTNHFTLAKVIEVDEITLNILPYIQENFSLDGEWKEAPNLTCTVSKTVVIAKQVGLIQKGTLKK